MMLQDLLTDIHALEEELLAFERQYGVRSEIFYQAYIHGASILVSGLVCTVPGFPGRLNTVMSSNGSSMVRLAWLVSYG